MNVGKAVSALTTQLSNIVVALQSPAAASTHIHSIPLESQSAPAAALASANSRLESVGSKYIRSPNASVAQAVPVIVIHVYLPSALKDGSSAIDEFSSSVIAPVIVPQDRFNLASSAVFAAFALGTVSSLALTDDRSLSIDSAAILPHVALPTIVCSQTVNATGVLSVVAYSTVLASYVDLRM